MSEGLPDTIAESYTRQLTAVLVVVTLVVGGVAGVQYAATASALTEDARADLQAAAERQAMQVDQWERERERLTTVVASDTGVNSVATDRVNGALEQQTESMPDDVARLQNSLARFEVGTESARADADRTRSPDCDRSVRTVHARADD